MKDPKSEGGKDSASTVCDATTADEGITPDSTTADEDSIKEAASADSDAIEQAEKDAQADADSAPDPDEDEPEKVIARKRPYIDSTADAEPIPPQTIDILAPFGDNQVSVIMYDEDDRIRRVARTSQGTTLRFVLNENERLFISVADPTQHDKYLAMRDEDAAARG